MIQAKEKPCKGSYKVDHFEGCGNNTTIYKFGLCRSCFMAWCFDTEKGIEYYNKQFKPAAAKKIKTDTDREQKEKNKSIAVLILEARKPYQQWIRMRDANYGCASCGQIDSEIWDAGHFKKAELYTGLIFDERNCNKQCRKCNTYLNGNEGEYRKRLIEKHGQEWMDELDRDSDRLRVYKWDREQLLEIKNEYLRRVKNKEI